MRIVDPRSPPAWWNIVVLGFARLQTLTADKIRINAIFNPCYDAEKLTNYLPLSTVESQVASCSKRVWDRKADLMAPETEEVEVSDCMERTMNTIL